jgi:Mlc titration factor MtfA (ptsG expression regulator)
VLNNKSVSLFFEKPAQLRKEHPELYEELYGFYRVNPVEWE